MLHPVRTLLYGLLIEPIVELWRRVADLVSPSSDSATALGKSVLLTNPSDPEGLPVRGSLPKS